MCFNSSTSLVAFIISVACSAYLYYNGTVHNNKSDVFFSAVVFLIGSMQLVEYFLWENQKCDKTNHIFSLFIVVVLTFQTIIWCLVYYYLYPKNRYFNNTIIMSYIFICICFFAYMMYYLKKFKLCSRPSATSCRLKWAPYELMASNNVMMFFIHIALYSSLGLIIGVEIIRNHLEDVFKYKMRYLFIPVAFILSSLYVLIKEINLSVNVIKNPYSLLFLPYADVFGSVFCFSAVLLGIISVLHL